MATANTYLTFNGNCEEAFTYYQTIFDGPFGHIARFGNCPLIRIRGYPGKQEPDYAYLPANRQFRIDGM